MMGAPGRPSGWRGGGEDTLEEGRQRVKNRSPATGRSGRSGHENQAYYSR